MEIQDLLNLEYEKLTEIKEKCLEYIDILSNIDDGKENGYRKLLMFFCDKLNVNKYIFDKLKKQIKKNEINVKVFINNIKKVESLVYSENKIQVHFEK